MPFPFGLNCVPLGFTSVLLISISSNKIYAIKVTPTLRVRMRLRPVGIRDLCVLTFGISGAVLDAGGSLGSSVSFSTGIFCESSTLSQSQGLVSLYV